MLADEQASSGCTNMQDVLASCINGDTRRVSPEVEQVYSENVVVTRFKNMLLPEECDYLHDQAKQIGLSRSTVLTRSGKRTNDERRTSNTAFLPKMKDPVIDCVSKRLGTYAGQPFQNMEPLQVTEYTHNKSYHPHHDYLNQKGSERTTTMFGYIKSDMLEDGKCGGATAFPRLAQEDGAYLRIHPRKGDVIMWSNRKPNGDLNPDTLHAGEAVTCKQAHKVGLNVWFRDTAWERGA